MFVERKPTIKGETITNVQMAQQYVDHGLWLAVGLTVAMVLSIVQGIYAFYYSPMLLSPLPIGMGIVVLGILLIFRWECFRDAIEWAFDEWDGIIWVLFLFSFIFTVYIVIPVIGVTITTLRVVAEYRGAKQYLNRVRGIPVNELFVFGSVKNQKRGLVLSIIATVILYGCFFLESKSYLPDAPITWAIAISAIILGIVSYILVGILNAFHAFVMGIEEIRMRLPICVICIFIMMIYLFLFIYLPPVGVALAVYFNDEE